MPETTLISVREAAEKLNCTPHYIRKLLRENAIRGGHVPGKKNLHVDPASLESYKKTEAYTNDINLLKQPAQITIQEAVEDVEEYFESDLISYVAMIGSPLSNIVHDDCIMLDDLLKNLDPEFPGTNGKKFKKITLFLQSGGGILDAAIKFVGIIKHYANEFDVIVPMMAKSAATLISLSADNIYMTPVSELGPVDPIIQNPANPSIMVPARSIDDLITEYSRKQRGLNTNERTDIDQIIQRKIEGLDIYLLASYKNALAFSKSQIENQLKRNIKDNPKLLEQAVFEFTEKYPSHSFPITFHDLEQYGLGKLIENDEKMNAVKTLLGVYQAFMAGNNIVKTLGNRFQNLNVVVQTINMNQVPTKTAI